MTGNWAGNVMVESLAFKVEEQEREVDFQEPEIEALETHV